MPTYKQIQNYVKTNYDYTVKTCWIADVKEMCGLHPRISPRRYDKAKRVHPCPPNKVEPIKEAFRHYGLIE